MRVEIVLLFDGYGKFGGNMSSIDLSGLEEPVALRLPKHWAGELSVVL